jgi:hypothetical protein
MWMTDYIKKVKCALRDEHGFKSIGGSDDDPLVEGPDGVYPITIEGKLENIWIRNGAIHRARTI